MRYSIKWVLIGGVIGLLVVSVSIILASSYLTSQRVLREHSQVIMQTIARFAIHEAQNYLAPAQHAAQLTQLMTSHDILRQDNLDQLEQYFYDQLSQYPHVSGMHLGFPTGAFIYVSRTNEKVVGGFRTKIIRMDRGQKQTQFIWKDAEHQELMREFVPDDVFDPTTRIWYDRAAKQGQTIWTEPYVFFTSRQWGVTVASPLLDKDGALMSVVGVDIEIDSISAFLSKLKISQHGRAFIVDRAGGVIALPELAQLKTASGLRGQQFRPVNIDELDDPLSQKAFATLQQISASSHLTASLFADFRHDQQIYHVLFEPFTSLQWPWVLGIYMPEDDYLGPIKRNRALNIAIMLAIAAVGSLIGWRLIQSLVQPMQALQREAHRIQYDDLDHPLDTYSLIREIQDTTTAFVHMKAGLQGLRERTRRLMQDIQTQANDLQHSEMRYRTLVEGSIQGISIARADGKRLYVNQALATLYGVDHPDELLNRSIHEHLPPHERERAIAERAACLAGTSPQIRNEYELRRGNGSTFWIERVLSRIDWDGEPALLATSFDITERKQAELALRKSESRYRRLFEAAPVGLHEHDWSGVKALIDQLRLQGIDDPVAHLHQGLA